MYQMKQIPTLVLCSIILISCSNGSTKNNSIVESSGNIITTSSHRETPDSSRTIVLASQTIAEIQKMSSENIIQLDCKKYQAWAKIFCNAQKEFFEKQANKITWEKVLAKGSLYATTFDCTKINSPYGKKYCQDYQEDINKTMTKEGMLQEIKKDVEHQASQGKTNN